MIHISPADFEHILSDPSSSYKEPEEVVHDDRLSRKQKIVVLKLWAHDERELEVAEEENMRSTSGRPPILGRVMRALREIENN